MGRTLMGVKGHSAGERGCLEVDRHHPSALHRGRSDRLIQTISAEATAGEALETIRLTTANRSIPAGSTCSGGGINPALGAAALSAAGTRAGAVAGSRRPKPAISAVEVTSEAADTLAAAMAAVMEEAMEAAATEAAVTIIES